MPWSCAATGTETARAEPFERGRGRWRRGAGDISLVDVLDAEALIRPAVPEHSLEWADLGAGTGTFTLALATLIGPAGRVIAVDRDVAALRSLRLAAAPMSNLARVSTIHADFTAPLDLPPLDGVLLANALHFVPEAKQSELLNRLAQTIRQCGRIAILEYEGRRPSRWVPHPVSFARLGALAREAGLPEPEHAGGRRSAFGGTMYLAVVPTRPTPETIARR